MAPFDGARSGTLSSGITNGREILAYALSQALKLAAVYAVNYAGLLTPIYLWAYRHGGGPMTYAVSMTISFAWGIAALLLFFLLRSAVDGVPTIADTAGRERPVMTRGTEIGAFLLAYAGVVLGLTALNVAYLASVYGELGRNRQQAMVFVLSLSVSIVSAVVVFLIFIGLRRAFAALSALPGGGGSI